MINVALVEDNVFSLKALEEKLSDYPDVKILFTATNGEEAVAWASVNVEVDLVLMDIEMPVMNGIKATAALKRELPGVKVVMITIYEDDDHIFQAIQAGADSYILKDTKAEKVYETIVDTMNGGSVMSPSIASRTLKLLKGMSSQDTDIEKRDFDLSVREIEILEQLSQGLTNKRIAENLFLSPFTVKRHIENIYQKLQAHNRIELLGKARMNKLI